MSLKYCYLVLVSVVLASCASMRTVCKVGAGMDVGRPSMHIYEVYEGSPADKAGIKAGGRVQESLSDIPTSGVKGEKAKFFIYYPHSGMVEFEVVQDEVCIQVW